MRVVKGLKKPLWWEQRILCKHCGAVLEVTKPEEDLELVHETSSGKILYAFYRCPCCFAEGVVDTVSMPTPLSSLSDD